MDIFDRIASQTRKSASDVLNDLEMRIARLEKQARIFKDDRDETLESLISDIKNIIDGSVEISVELYGYKGDKKAFNLFFNSYEDVKREAFSVPFYDRTRNTSGYKATSKLKRRHTKIKKSIIKVIRAYKSRGVSLISIDREPKIINDVNEVEFYEFNLGEYTRGNSSENRFQIEVGVE